MKKFKRISAMLLIFVMIFSFVACSENDNETSGEYPEITAVDINKISLGKVNGNGFTFCYPYDTWTPVEDIEPVTVIWDETLDVEEQVNINIQIESDWPENELSEETAQLLKEELEKNAFYDVQLAEMRLFMGAPAVYMECTLAYTDESLDAAIAQGSLTADMIDDAGGRDVLKAMPPIKQIILYVLSDDNLSIVIGSYFEEAQKQTVIDTMTVIAQTVEF